jgi:protein TonB
VQGTTLLKVHVNASGLVEDVRVEHSAGHSELDVAAMEAVKQWKFEPARQGRQPVAVWVMLPVRFTLR